MTDETRNKIYNTLLRALDDAVHIAADAINVPSCNGRDHVDACEVGDLHSTTAVLATLITGMLTDPINTEVNARAGIDAELHGRLVYQCIDMHQRGRRERERGEIIERVFAFVQGRGFATASEIRAHLHITATELGDAVEVLVKMKRLDVDRRGYKTL